MSSSLKKTLIFLISFLCICGSVWANPPITLATKQAFIRYHDSGQYEKDIDRVIDQALCYLQHRQYPQGKIPALILDIDETALSNYPSLLKLNFGGSLEENIAAENLGIDPAITPTLKLYRYAKSHHIAVFFITGRTESQRAVTVKNLKAAGYDDWNGLFLRGKGQEKLSASLYKATLRKRLSQQGYLIILNIGDQLSDLRGDYSGQGFKLPNPYYFIP